MQGTNWDKTKMMSFPPLSILPTHKGLLSSWLDQLKMDRVSHPISQRSGFDSWSNLIFFLFFFNCLHLLNCENHFHFQYWLHCIIMVNTFSVKFWGVRAKQTEFYLEAFSRRSKTVFKNTNCPEAVIIPQATRGSKVK